MADYSPMTLADLAADWYGQGTARRDGNSYGSSSRSTGGNRKTFSRPCCATSHRQPATSGGTHC